MKKPAHAAYPLHPLIAERWSPRVFSKDSVDLSVIGSLMEAARWAPSCFNEQPWRFFIGHREHSPELLAVLQGLLMDGNAWAKEAPVLMLSVAALKFAYNGKPNRHALHDVGLAVENLVLQAEDLGLMSHQMAGYHLDKSYTALNLNPEEYEPVAMIALGYPGDPESLPADLKARELGERERRPLQEIAWGSVLQGTFPGCYS